MSMDAGLVGHWKFNEKSGITTNDSSRYRNTGTLTGATHLPVWAEKGIKFDGVDDYVNCGNDASLNITNAITISAWIKSTKTTDYNTIVSNLDINAYNGYDFFTYTGGTIYMQIANATTRDTLMVTKSVTDGTWHMVTAVSDATTLSIFVNGIFIGSGARTVADMTFSENPLIGSRHSGTDPYFNGSIDEVRIFNRALSANEIKRNYEATKHNYI